MKKLILVLVMAIFIIACNQKPFIQDIQEFEQCVSDYRKLNKFLLDKGFSKSVILLDSGYKTTYESPQVDVTFQLWAEKTYITVYYVDTVNATVGHLFYINGKNVTDSLKQYEH